MRAVLAFAFSLLAFSAQGQWQVPQLETAPQIDGRLEEAVWEKALVVLLPYEVEPGDSVPALTRTECLLLSTREALYVGFRAYDPDPRQVRAHLADRDQFFRDDFVGILLDTFADHRRAFEFVANPLGVQGDALRTVSGNGEEEDFRWDAIWQAAGQLTDFGYQVEMAIPFSALRFPAGEGEKTFGFAAFRAYPRSLRRIFFSNAFDRNNACSLCQLPHITGFANAQPGRQVEVNPTWVVTSSQEREELEDPHLPSPKRQGDAGASLLWGITPNVSLNLTVNPDFSQVEADARQLSINRVFSLFFREKRPFFLEGSDLFSTPLHAVYTRTMADPQWGIKLTGKQAASAFGLLLVRDNLTPLILPGPESSSTQQVAMASTAAVARYRYDLGAASNLGFLATRREGNGLRSELFGFDGLWRLGKSNTFTWQWLRSTTQYPWVEDLGSEAGQSHRGTAWQASFSHATRTWEAWAWGRNIGDGFRADLGFMPQVGVRGGEVGAQRIFWGQEGSWYSMLALGGEMQRWEDQKGQLLEEVSRLMARYQGPLQSTVFLNLSRFRKTWEGVEFSGASLRLFTNVRFTGDFTASCGLEGGDAIDYGANRPARRWALSPGFTLNLGRHVYLQGDFLGEKLRVAEGELYRAFVADVKVMVHLSVRSFLRLLTQLEKVQTHPQLYPDPPQRLAKTWNHQLLFAYKVNPQTLLYLGASHGAEGNQPGRAVTTQRSLFLKVSYNWQV